MKVEGDTYYNGSIVRVQVDVRPTCKKCVRDTIRSGYANTIENRQDLKYGYFKQGVYNIGPRGGPPADKK